MAPTTFIMKRLIAILFICLMGATAAHAQDFFQKIEGMKLDYVAQKVTFTPKESEKFWPVYKQYQAELTQIKMQKFKYNKQLRNQNSGLSDEELNENLDKMLQFEQRELEVKQKYKSELLKSISIQKLTEVYNAERDFKQQVLRNYQDRKELKKG